MKSARNHGGKIEAARLRPRGDRSQPARSVCLIDAKTRREAEVYRRITRLNAKALQTLLCASQRLCAFASNLRARRTAELQQSTLRINSSLQATKPILQMTVRFAIILARRTKRHHHAVPAQRRAASQVNGQSLRCVRDNAGPTGSFPAGPFCFMVLRKVAEPQRCAERPFVFGDAERVPTQIHFESCFARLSVFASNLLAVTATAS